MIIGENIFAMLLAEKFFCGFIPGKKISDSNKSAEALMGITAESREEVDEMLSNAVSAGGREYGKAADHGWMYGRAFEDLDGHIWEIFYMDMGAMPEEMKRKGGK